MDLKELEAIINLAKKEGVISLNYETKDIKVSVSLPHPQSASFLTSHSHGGHVFPEMKSALPNPNLNVGSSPNSSANKGKNPHSAGGKEDGNLHKITSPFVGTFYTSPSPGESAYVKVGDRVKKGQVLCIVEAMKIMNEIDCDVTGEVVEMCVENESLVEYGQVLFLIRTGV